VSYLLLGIFQGMEHYKTMEEESVKDEEAYYIMKNFMKRAIGDPKEEDL